MKIRTILTAGIAISTMLSASQTAHAHASFTVGGAAGTPVWLNGVPSTGVEFPNTDSNINIPSVAFIGLHGATASNNRIIETGVDSTAATDAQLGSSWNGVTTSYKNTLLGQLANYDATATTPIPFNGGINQYNSTTSTGYDEAVAVTQGSWGNGVSSIYNASTNTFNQGDLYMNPYAGSGSSATTPDGELNIIQSTGAQYLNVSITTDQYAVTGNQSSSLNELAYAIYQGDATGPGLQGMVLLGTGVATSPGQELDFSIALQGAYLNNNPFTGGDFTLVIGDVSQSADPNAANYIATSNFDPYVKVAFWETGAGSQNSANGLLTNSNLVYQEQGTIPTVPVPGAVWLFGSALAGVLGISRRHQPVAVV